MHADEVMRDGRLQVDALYQSAIRPLEQRGSLQQEVGVQRLEIAGLKGRLGELRDELEGLKSRNRRLPVTRALIVSGADMDIAKGRIIQMIK